MKFSLQYLRAIFKNYHYPLMLLLAVGVTIGGYLIFKNSPAFLELMSWARTNIIWFGLALIVIKIIGIVWPPLPGSVFTIGAVPIIGWWNAYLIDAIGGLIGSCVAYALARKWGLKFLRKVFDERAVEQIQKLKIHKHRELEFISIMRVFGGTVAEFIAYGAGLTKVGVGNFVLGTVISYIAAGIPLFYLFNIVFGGKNLLFAIIPLAIIVALVAKYRKRYFVYGG